MVKNSALPTSRNSALPKVVGMLITLALLVVVVKHPSEAAECAKVLGAWIGAAADGITKFMQQITA
jgi:hypothetical protein